MTEEAESESSLTDTSREQHGAPARLLDIKLLGRHQVAAALATAVDFSVMVALVELAHAPPPVATLVSSATGGVTNFTIGRAWAFRLRHRGSMLSQAARYAVTCAGGGVLNAALLGALLTRSLLPYVFARVIVCVMVSLAYTYPMHTRFVFRAARPEGDGRAS